MHPVTGATVLLLDDDRTMLHILEGILSGAGYDCCTVNDADEALRLVGARPDVALVLSDIVMPKMNGLEFVQRMNAMKLDRPAPRVLLLTAQPSLEMAVDALRLGVNDFLVKPIRPPELIEAVRCGLAQAHLDRAVGAGRPPEIERLLREAEAFASRLRSLAYAADMPSAVHAEPQAGASPDLQAGAREDLHAGANEEPQAGAREERGHGAAGAGIPARHDLGIAARPAVLDIIEELRHLRGHYVQHKLDDIAWDLLLELLRAERLSRRLSVSGLTISITGVSVTTSLRRVNELVARGYLSRVADPADARRDFVSLTPKANELLEDYLVRANACLDDLASQRSRHQA